MRVVFWKFNAIEHGNKEDEKKYFEITIYFQPGKVEVSIKDYGKGFTKYEKEPQIEEKIKNNQRKRGWGLYLIKQLVDQVNTKRDEDGFILTFVKTF